MYGAKMLIFRKDRLINEEVSLRIGEKDGAGKKKDELVLSVHEKRLYDDE